MVDLFILIFFLFGACIGSFANVVIYRLPKKLSVVRPGSFCYKCNASIAWYDNIPIFSWLILQGRCRKCKAPFSVRYPIVELIMAILFAALYLKLGWSWLLLEYLVLVSGLVTASMIDLDHMILPDVFTLNGIALGLIGGLINPERHLWPDAIMGVLLGGGFLWAVAAIYSAIRKQDGMGGGDIKLLAWIGAVLGWTSVPFVIIGSSLVGSVVGILLMSKTKDGLKHAIPFGPYISIAAIIYIFYGYELSRMYLQFFLPSLQIP